MKVRRNKNRNLRKLDFPKKELNNLLSRHVMIISRFMMPAFLQKYQGRLAAGIVVFEEVHDYKGQKGKPTQAFQSLQKMVKASRYGTLAIGLSASLLGYGPIGWRPFIEHNREQAELLKVTSEFRDVTTKMVDTWENDFNYLLNRLGGDEEENSRGEDLQVKYDSFQKTVQRFIPRLILARTARSKFRGKPVSDRQPALFQLIPCDMPKGPVQMAHRTLASSIKKVSSFKVSPLFSIHLFQACAVVVANLLF